MLLRRLAENLRMQNWKAVAIELFVLTSGVFLGLQAENWNQDRKDRAEAQAYIERLSKDFTAIRDSTRSVIEELDREIEALSVLSELAEGDRARNDEEYADFMREIAYYTIPPSRAASYIDILESNNLGLLDDRPLIDLLIRCDNNIQGFWFSHEIRKRMEFETGQAYFNLFLDSEGLSFREALERTDPESDSFRRALVMGRLVRLSEKGDFGAILECSTEILNRLATRAERGGA